LPGFYRLHTQNAFCTDEVIAEVVDAMTTNESMFFRDQKPFDQLRQVILPRFREEKGQWHG